MRRTFLLAICAALAGCAAHPVEKSQPVPVGTPQVDIVGGRDVALIRITLLDRLPIRSATLALPNGTSIDAESVDDTVDPQEITGLGGFGPVAPAYMQGTTQGVTKAIGQIRSLAVIRVSNVADYNKTWRQAKVSVVIGNPGSSTVRVLPAPAPP